MDQRLRELVRERAGGHCEYCGFPQEFSVRPFHCDHVVAQQHGGETVTENLAWACNHCNLHKGPNLTSIDPLTGQTTRLFHPRSDHWEDHFLWQGPVLLAGPPSVALLFTSSTPMSRWWPPREPLS
jgi:5-methylcytosine-specific restriction endonuclease McrA